MFHFQHKHNARAAFGYPLCVAALALSLAACGGGGGGGGGTRSFSSNFDDSGQQAQWGLSTLNADTAYARLPAGTEPGEGVQIGVVDTGILYFPDFVPTNSDTPLIHPEFEGQDIDQRFLNQPRGEFPDPSHGSAVAGIIIAAREDDLDDFYGIAYGASLTLHSVTLGSADPNQNYDPITTLQIGGIDQGFAGRTRIVLGEAAYPDDGRFVPRPDILNLSFGYQGLSENYDQSAANAFSQSIAALAQNGVADANIALIVVSAGNGYFHRCAPSTDNCDLYEVTRDGETSNEYLITATSPSFIGGLPLLAEELRGHMVAVVATDQSGDIAQFSHHCGIAAKWCIAAPGVAVPTVAAEITASGAELGYTESYGTSFAAPHVTGALAVLMQVFRGQMGNTAVLQRLKDTADRTGDAAPDDVATGDECPPHLNTDNDLTDCELSSIYGWGIIDLGAAASPVGTMMFPIGIPLDLSFIETGAAFGDALQQAFGAREVAAFDELHAPFWVPLAQFIDTSGGGGAFGVAVFATCAGATL